MAQSFLTHQDPVFLKLKTPLGENVLALKKLFGQEKISEVFEFDLLLLSERKDIDFDELIGQEVVVTLECGPNKRYFHGIIGEFLQSRTDFLEQSDLTTYTAKIFPKLWLLNFTRDCRIFQNKTVIDIITTIFEENQITSVEFRLPREGWKVREYCVQYNESCFNFVSRLLESEGIFYFFEHNENDHKLVLANSRESHQACLYAEVAQMETSKRDVSLMNRIKTCDILRRVIPDEHALADFNFKTPGTRLFSTFTSKGEGRRIYEYPGRYDTQRESDKLTRLRLETDEFPHKSISGLSTIPFFAPGFSFVLQGHLRNDANQKYVLHAVKHYAELGEDNECHAIYSNEYSAFPHETPYRPPLKTPRPFIPSTQTAIVTGKEGEEIWTDEYGRVKVRFHWDQMRGNDQNSSCWIRVAQGWAGNNWGFLFTPRIGMEVVVQHLEGDPDRPLITGCVYNAEHIPAYLPNQPTKSTIKSHSSKGGTDKNYNEIRFEDLKNQEEIYVQAEKDLNILVKNNRAALIENANDETTINCGDRRVILKGQTPLSAESSFSSSRTPSSPKGVGDDTLVIHKGKRVEKLLGQGEGPGDYITEITKGDRRLLIVKGNEERTLESGDRTLNISQGNETHNNGKDFVHNVSGNYSLNIEGDLEINVKGAIKINGLTTISLKAMEQASVESLNVAIKGGLEVELNAGAALKASSKGVATFEGLGANNISSTGIVKINGAIIKIN